MRRPMMEKTPVLKSKKRLMPPVRTCCVCRKKDLKSSLIRLVLQDGQPVQDARQDKVGRGAYCCNSGTCLVAFVSQQKRWKRALKVKN